MPRTKKIKWSYCLITFMIYENDRGLYNSQQEAIEALDKKLLEEKFRLEDTVKKYQNHIAKIVRYFNDKRRNDA